jgi:hypothetical protein
MSLIGPVLVSVTRVTDPGRLRWSADYEGFIVEIAGYPMGEMGPLPRVSQVEGYGLCWFGIAHFWEEDPIR